MAFLNFGASFASSRVLFLVILAHVSQTSVFGMICSNCQMDVVHNCLDTFQTCNGSTPLCLTSFIHTGTGNQTTSKTCASVDTCEKLWWNKSRLNSICVSNTTDPLSHPVNQPIECYYCCESNPRDPQNWCNKNQFPTKPKNLVDIPQYKISHGLGGSTAAPTNTTTITSGLQQKSTTEPSTLTTRPQTTGPNTNPQLNTTLPPTTKYIFQNTTSQPNTNILQNTTSKPNKNVVQNTTTQQNTNTPNTSVLPNTTLQSNTNGLGNTTTVTATSSLPNTTKRTTTNTAMTGAVCEVCRDDPATGKVCHDTQTHACPANNPLCMNTVERTPTHGLTLSVNKHCASEQACYNRWWKDTRHRAECQGDMTDPVAINTSCTFCCKDEMPGGVPCNIHSRPRKLVDLSQYRRTTTPHTLRTPSPVPRSCVQCGNRKTGQGCSDSDIFLSTSDPCPQGLSYCINDVMIDGAKKVVYKRCVDYSTCYNEWYDFSSDKTRCTNYDPTKGTRIPLNCTYCCVTDGCNKGIKPVDLFDKNDVF